MLPKTGFSIILLIVSLLFFACKSEQNQDATAFGIASAEAKIFAMIEIPAGTNQKIEYDKSAGKFAVDQIDGEDRVIQFLPYPGNYGYLKNTMMDKDRGGDGDALDVLVISEHLKTGTKIGVKPIAALLLKDRGEIDTKIIAIPIDSSLQVMPAQNFNEFSIKYSAAKTIIEQWFLNYKGLGNVESMGWRDDRFAKVEIEKWTNDDEE